MRQRKVLQFVATLLLIFAFKESIGVVQPPKVTLSLKKVSLTEAINQLVRSYKVDVAYNPELTDRIKITVSIQNQSIEAAFRILTEGSGLKVTKVDERSFIIFKPTKEEPPPPPVKKKQYTLSGYISQKGSGERLIAATVRLPSLAMGCFTNEYGYYSITLEEGSYPVIYTYVGSQPQQQMITLNQNKIVNIELEGGSTLQQVVIKGDNIPEEHTQPQMSRNNVAMEYVKGTPLIFGEADVLKVLQLLPGVKGGTEGSAGVYIRGGSPDQNLVLLDGVPIYNPQHLLGFFSIFNADAINSTQLLKGGFPARYGERLSSVIDIRMKEGNMEKYEGEVSLGLVSSKISLSGPIVKDKTSFIISARRTYIDIITAAINQSEDSEISIPNIYFYDINAKINHTFSHKDRLYLSFYKGRDAVSFREGNTYSLNDEIQVETNRVGYNWGNALAVLRWNHIFTPKLFANTTATFGRYNYRAFSTYKIAKEEAVSEKYTSSRFLSGIDDLGFRVDLDYHHSPRHNFKLGVAATNHFFSPSINEYNEKTPDDNVNESNVNRIEALELALYGEDLYQFNEKLSANIGIRTSLFNVQGRSYMSAEPRISINYITGERASIKFSYAEMSQYLHFLTSSSITLPSDLWVPTTRRISPQRSRQVAIGYNQQLGRFDFSAEAYYKRMANIIEYKDGTSFTGYKTDWEETVTTGRGDSYGLELLLAKKLGRLNGWIGYTLSWSTRTFDMLNHGRTFPYNYDRRHDISITANYKLSSKIDVGATWVYATGRAFTLGSQNYPAFDERYPLSAVQKISDNSDRNAYRFPAFHRLDLGINFRKKKRWGERTWSVNLYNVYNQHNTFFLYPNYEEKKFMSVKLFSFLPSVTYSLKF